MPLHLSSFPTRLLACALALFLASVPTLTPAQDGQAPAAQPRVTGQGQVQGAEVIVNQVEATRYPKVTLFATVLRDGKPVRGLAAADFRVREDEVDQGPLAVEPRLIPLYAAVVLDTSGSMRQRLPEAKTAAQTFVDALGASDRVRAFSFAREVKALNGPTAERAAAKTGLNGTAARGDTALYDALYAGIEATKEQPGRKAVVLLSDGVDDDGTGKQLSKRSLTEALDLARSVNVPVYTIGLGTEIDEGILKRAAEESGGQYFKAPEASQLKDLYARIAEQLSGQYSIAYESNLPADGEEHRVRLTVGGVDAAGTKVFRAPRGPQGASEAAVAAPSSEAGPEAVVSADGRVSGGDGFDNAVTIEPGRAYKLQDHLGKGEFAYFAFEAKGGQTIAATVRTGAKGVAAGNNTYRETSNPHGGIALVSPAQEMIGKPVTIIGDALKKDGLQARIASRDGGRFYLLVGSRYGALHADTEFAVELTGQAQVASAAGAMGAGAAPALPPPSKDVQRVNGGASFEAATPIEPGRSYRLTDLVPKNEAVYLSVEVPPGKTLVATAHTGLKGISVGSSGVLSENDNPHAGLAVAGPDQRLIGERQTIIGDELRRIGGRYRLAGGKGGRLYLIVGSPYGAVHQDTRIATQIVDN